MVPAHPAREHARPHRVVEQQVAVAALLDREACVEIRRHFPSPHDGDAGGQMRVDAAHPGGERARRADVEMRHLVARMHAGVGAPGRHHRDFFAGDHGHRPFQVVLDAATRGLRLPAAETAAVVFQADGDPHALTLASTIKSSAAEAASIQASRPATAGMSSVISSGPSAGSARR